MSQISFPTDQHPLVARVTKMRGRVRAVISAFGIGVILAAAVASLVFLIFADYFIHIPASARLVLLITWIIALSVLAWRNLISPLSTRLTDQFLASRVENIHKDLADELISAVHFIHAGTIRTNALAARHVDSAAAKTANIRFEDAVDFRRSTKALGIAALVILVTAILAATNQGFTKVALSRWFTNAPIAWPHQTHVEFSWPNGKQPAVIPIGEQFLVRAKVTQGGYPNQRVWITTWADTKSPTEELMTYQPSMSTTKEFVYEKTLEPEGDASLSLRLQAGDDREQPPVEIHLAARPVVREVVGSIAPPAYVKDVKDPTKPAASVMVDLMSQAGRAVEGSTISLNVRSTKAFMLDEKGRPMVRLLDQSKDVDIVMGMTSELIAPDTARITFPATKRLEGRLSVRDTDGFENRAGGTLSIDVLPDGLPSVVITEPRRMAERTGDGFVDIALSATDDWGVDGIKLVAEKFDAKPGEAPVFETALTWADRTVDAAVGSTTGHAVYKWDLAPLKLQPGARLSFYAMVQDNYDVQGKRHPWVKSAPLTLQILSQSDLEKIERDALNRVKEQIKTLKTEQEKTQAKTDAIQKAAAESGVTTAQQKQQLAELAQQQNQEAATANGIQQKVEQIKDDLRQNKMAESELGKISDAVSEGMKEVGQDNMPKAASDLNKAHEAAGNKDPKDGAKQDEKSREQAKETAGKAQSASKQQGEAIAKMNNMIGQLGAAGDLAAALSQAREIKDKQDKLTEATQKAAAKTVGKEVDKLSKEDKAALEKLASDQKELQKKTDDLINSMDKSAEQQQQSDPAASQSMKSAAEAGKKSDVPGAQSQAAGAISKNQTSSAQSSQSQAQAGLQQMIDELSKNEKRELENLQRQLTELLQEVTKLKTDEEALNKDTIAAGEKAIAALMSKLGDRQGTLQMNTIVVQKKAENTKDAQKAAADIRDAADHMATAAGPLYGSKQHDALDPEIKAIESLTAAIEKLQKQKDKVDTQLKDKQLAEFIKQYEAVKVAQATIKTTSDQIETRKQAAADKQIDRLGLRDAARLATTQSGLIDEIAKLSSDDKLKEFDVIVWMNSQIMNAMGSSKDDLAKAQTGIRLATAQQTAIDRINDIIQALKEEQSKPDEFDKGDGGGGGGGGGGKKPLVPPLAQIKLIRAMQNIVNTQTVGVNKAMQAAKNDADKAQLQNDAEKLGKTQGELKTIVEKIMKQMN